MNPIFPGQGRIVNEKEDGLTYRWSLANADFLLEETCREAFTRAL